MGIRTTHCKGTKVEHTVMVIALLDYTISSCPMVNLRPTLIRVYKFMGDTNGPKWSSQLLLLLLLLQLLQQVGSRQTEFWLSRTYTHTHIRYIAIAVWLNSEASFGSGRQLYFNRSRNWLCNFFTAVPRGWDIGPTLLMGPSPRSSWNAQSHWAFHKGQPLYIHTTIHTWLGIPGRPPYVIPRGSTGWNKTDPNKNPVDTFM